jgi:hypothetical protein
MGGWNRCDARLAMNFVERYRNGEHRRVTYELASLSDMNPTIRREAEAVAELAMARVAYNCELIAKRLAEYGYTFSVYCDPDDHGGAQSPIVRFDANQAAALRGLEAKFKALPLSLTSFWTMVGGVAFTGTHPDFPNMLDPLVIYPADAVFDESAYAEPEDDGQFHLALSPDDFHKDNVSGGMPYSVALPQAGFDFELLYEARKTTFIEYLRDTILSRGGFAAFEPHLNSGVPLATLTADLIPF